MAEQIHPSFCSLPPFQVWNHFDSGSCPGQAIGVRSRLDNGVQGFIPTKFLSDKVVKHPEERVKVSIFFFVSFELCYTNGSHDHLGVPLFSVICETHGCFWCLTSGGNDGSLSHHED